MLSQPVLGTADISFVKCAVDVFDKMRKLDSLVGSILAASSVASHTGSPRNVDILNDAVGTAVRSLPSDQQILVWTAFINGFIKIHVDAVSKGFLSNGISLLLLETVDHIYYRC